MVLGDQHGQGRALGWEPAQAPCTRAAEGPLATRQSLCPSVPLLLRARTATRRTALPTAGPPGSSCSPPGQQRAHCVPVPGRSPVPTSPPRASTPAGSLFELKFRVYIKGKFPARAPSAVIRPLRPRETESQPLDRK